MVSAWLYDLDAAFLYPAIAVLIAGAGELGNFVGRRFGKTRTDGSDIGTLTGASLGLLALLLAFSFSLALSRYEARPNRVLEEANAIGSTANFALMLRSPRKSRSSICCAPTPPCGLASAFPTTLRNWSTTLSARWNSRTSCGSRL